MVIFIAFIRTEGKPIDVPKLFSRHKAMRVTQRTNICNTSVLQLVCRRHRLATAHQAGVWTLKACQRKLHRVTHTRHLTLETLCCTLSRILNTLRP